MYVDNIIHTYLSGTDDEISEGLHWYDSAHNLALELSPGDVWRGAGVIAAFSPMQKWDINVRNARNAFLTGVASGHTKAMCSVAQRILDGEPALEVLKGDKTRAFAAAIADPANSTIATIDRHAHDIAMGRVFNEADRKIGKVLFRAMSDSYVEAANLAGISVAQMQAATWVVWRNRKGVK